MLKLRFNDFDGVITFACVRAYGKYSIFQCMGLVVFHNCCIYCKLLSLSLLYNGYVFINCKHSLFPGCFDQKAYYLVIAEASYNIINSGI